jgi:hypothetical protein
MDDQNNEPTHVVYVPVAATTEPEQKPDGLIQKAEAIAENAIETGLEKTSNVVGTVIDKVADAAQATLGGKTDKN